MLSLELDVENVSRATRTDPQGDSVTRLLLQGQVGGQEAGVSLGPGLWVRTIPVQCAL